MSEQNDEKAPTVASTDQRIPQPSDRWKDRASARALTRKFFRDRDGAGEFRHFRSGLYVWQDSDTLVSAIVSTTVQSCQQILPAPRCKNSFKLKKE